eukprot:CAMPEP_0206436718 /NCGR_PEP_ID=MMETSP0324_2-20121206/10641_1 /ASSEMBLY_ACC=CAM_ASM_000836 /TAXON_ID=2866 /ORGANISM="Crypthecodinium cohnii, Strain Seligo" /LENGTH=227 /DNA_ID=CAMNT_0053903919 /DNA_START=164 /DNA_END=848 /DNA_ORIENTATION=-
MSEVLSAALAIFVFGLGWTEMTRSGQLVLSLDVGVQEDLVASWELLYTGTRFSTGLLSTSLVPGSNDGRLLRRSGLGGGVVEAVRGDVAFLLRLVLPRSWLPLAVRDGLVVEEASSFGLRHESALGARGDQRRCGLISANRRIFHVALGILSGELAKCASFRLGEGLVEAIFVVLLGAWVFRHPFDLCEHATELCGSFRDGAAVDRSAQAALGYDILRQRKAGHDAC